MAIKITSTTGNRGQDADWNRIYSLVTSLQNRVAVLEAPMATPTPVVPNILPPPDISAASTVTDVVATAVVGVLSSYAREDHAHDGVQSIYCDTFFPKLTGVIQLISGTGMYLQQVGNNITINGVFGTVTPKVVPQSFSPYTVQGGDINIFAEALTAPMTIELVGGAINTGRLIWISNRGASANNVTVTTTTGSVLNITTIAPGGSVLYISDGSNWYSIMNSTGN